MTDAAQPLAARLRAPRVYVVDDAIEPAVAVELGRWLHDQRHRFGRVGDVDGAREIAHELVDFDEHAPELAATIRAAVLQHHQAACAACFVTPFDPAGVEMRATLHHHGGHHGWRLGYAEPRSIDYVLTLRSDPPMFRGGELETLDGSTFEPVSGRLVYIHPEVARRVRLVECWSAHVLHGRWSIRGAVLSTETRG